MILYEIETAEEFRRKGLGRAMVEEFLRICKERGFLKAWVPTNAGNTAAIALYASAGGERLSEADPPVTFTWYSAEPTADG
jgi:ribosomal protein S18 acetylase RimI-like enzyme